MCNTWLFTEPQAKEMFSFYLPYLYKLYEEYPFTEKKAISQKENSLRSQKASEI